MKILVTGAAGFIGFHTIDKLLNYKNYKVVGIDNLNNYYDISLKKKRIKILLKKHKNKFFLKKLILQIKKLKNLFKNYKFKKVINLAAQAGVRYVKKNPDAYFESNIRGFYNIVELCKNYKIKHWFQLALVVFMELIKTYRLQKQELLTILLSFTLQQKDQTRS